MAAHRPRPCLFQFDISVPEYTPASFRTYTHGECKWMVGFVADDLEEGVVTLASKPITKCTMMYPLPGFVPTAQAEATMLRGAKLIAGALGTWALYVR